MRLKVLFLALLISATYLSFSDSLKEPVSILTKSTKESDRTVKSYVRENLVMSRWVTRQGNFWDKQQWLCGDFNGDGKCDMAKVFIDNGYTNVDVHISKNGTFEMQRWVTQEGGFWDEQKWISGDFNGDGKCDIAMVFKVDGYTSIDIRFSKDNTFKLEQWATKLTRYSIEPNWLTGDFDGDGKCDIINVSVNGWENYFEVFFIKDDGFVTHKLEIGQESFNPNQQWVSGDFDGDGKCDVASINNSGHEKVTAYLAKYFTESQRHVSLPGPAGFYNRNYHGRVNYPGQSRFGYSGHYNQGPEIYDPRYNRGQTVPEIKQKCVAGDFDGDKMCDIAEILKDREDATITIHRSGKGRYFMPQYWHSGQGSYNDSQQWMAGRFSGDAKYAISKVFNDANMASIDVHSLN